MFGAELVVATGTDADDVSELPQEGLDALVGDSRVDPVRLLSPGVDDRDE